MNTSSVGPKVSPTSFGVGSKDASQELLDKLLENAKHNPEDNTVTIPEGIYYTIDDLLRRLASILNAGKSPYEMVVTHGIPLPTKKETRGGKYKSRRHHKKHHNKRRHTRRS